MNNASDDERPCRCAASELRARLDFDDARLLRECEIHFHRTGGPGGQHRNKVCSAVRLVHKPSGLAVTGEERRSQHENKAVALWRLRELIALVARIPLPQQVEWPPELEARDGRLRVSDRNPRLHHAIALVLDSLATNRGALREAAARLGLTPSSVVRFLGEHPKAWREAQRIRELHGLPPLLSK
ncbi:MAG: peptide chain release factor-like protein [Phycisphaerae bacterium]